MGREWQEPKQRASVRDGRQITELENRCLTEAFGGDGAPVVREGGAACPSPALAPGRRAPAGRLHHADSLTLRRARHTVTGGGSRAVSQGHFRRACRVWKEDGGLIKCSLAATTALIGSRAY